MWCLNPILWSVEKWLLYELLCTFLMSRFSSEFTILFCFSLQVILTPTVNQSVWSAKLIAHVIKTCQVVTEPLMELVTTLNIQHGELYKLHWGELLVRPMKSSINLYVYRHFKSLIRYIVRHYHRDFRNFRNYLAPYMTVIYLPIRTPPLDSQ